MRRLKRPLLNQFSYGPVLVLPLGFEPRTVGLEHLCSSIELRQLIGTAEGIRTPDFLTENQVT